MGPGHHTAACSAVDAHPHLDGAVVQRPDLGTVMQQTELAPGRIEQVLLEECVGGSGLSDSAVGRNDVQDPVVAAQLTGCQVVSGVAVLAGPGHEVLEPVDEPGSSRQRAVDFVPDCDDHVVLAGSAPDLTGLCLDVCWLDQRGQKDHLLMYLPIWVIY